MSQLSPVVYQPIQKLSILSQIYTLNLRRVRRKYKMNTFFKDIISTAAQTCLSKLCLINTSLDLTISSQRQPL